MDLVHDYLDAQRVDRAGTKIGRIDSLVIAVDGDGPPRIVAAESGPVPLARRIHPRLAAWLAGWLRRRGSPLAQPYRIAWAELRPYGRDFAIGIEGASTPLDAGERWTREHVVCRIPGA